MLGRQAKQTSQTVRHVIRIWKEKQNCKGAGRRQQRQMERCVQRHSSVNETCSVQGITSDSGNYHGNKVTGEGESASEAGERGKAQDSL